MWFGMLYSNFGWLICPIKRLVLRSVLFRAACIIVGNEQ